MYNPETHLGALPTEHPYFEPYHDPAPPSLVGAGQGLITHRYLDLYYRSIGGDFEATKALLDALRTINDSIDSYPFGDPTSSIPFNRREDFERAWESVNDRYREQARQQSNGNQLGTSGSTAHSPGPTPQPGTQTGQTPGEDGDGGGADSGSESSEASSETEPESDEAPAESPTRPPARRPSPPVQESRPGIPDFPLWDIGEIEAPVNPGYTGQPGTQTGPPRPSGGGSGSDWLDRLGEWALETGKASANSIIEGITAQVTANVTNEAARHLPFGSSAYAHENIDPKSAGQWQRDFNNAAFPGTTPWEQLGGNSPAGAFGGAAAGQANVEKQVKNAVALQVAELKARGEIAKANNMAAVIAASAPLGSDAVLHNLGIYSGADPATLSPYDTQVAQGRERLDQIEKPVAVAQIADLYNRVHVGNATIQEKQALTEQAKQATLLLEIQYPKVVMEIQNLAADTRYKLADVLFKKLETKRSGEQWRLEAAVAELAPEMAEAGLAAEERKNMLTWLHTLGEGKGNMLEVVALLGLAITGGLTGVARIPRPTPLVGTSKVTDTVRKGIGSNIERSHVTEHVIPGKVHP